MLRIVSYNIRFGGRARRTAIGQVLCKTDGDVVLLQEATDAEVVRALAAELGLAVVAWEPGESVAVLSRAEVAATLRHRTRAGRSIVEVRLTQPPASIFAVHLSAGLSRRGESRRLQEAAVLLRAVTAGGQPERSILAGDFNAVAPGDQPLVARMPAWIRVVLRVDGGIRTDMMSTLVEAGYVDAYRRLHPTEPGATMPSILPTVRLDYALLGRGLVDRLDGCAPCDVDPELLMHASDHLPLVTSLRI
jgi:endonuclease/exonuclease/phosphatase family metal-dependent hydrolase